MNIKMELIPNYEENNGFKYCFNKMTLFGVEKDGSAFCEEDILALDFWKQETYEKQWRDGLERIKKHDTSCLVASIQNPLKSPLVKFWVLYKIDRNIHLQNHMFIAEIYEELIGKNLLTPENCYDFLIRPRETADEDGQKISEWVVSAD